MICPIVGAAVLTSIANASEAMILFSRTLEIDPSVEQILRVVDVRNYVSGSMVEMFVDAELACGVGIVFWIDISWREDWRIEPSVRLSVSGGDEAVSLGVRVAVGEQAMAMELDRAVQDLVEARKAVDLCDPYSYFQDSISQSC